MSLGVSPGGKRGLREVLEVGFTHEQARKERERGVLFDVTSSNGERFGLCVRATDGKHVYVEPQQLSGVEVMQPMVVRTHANNAFLRVALGSALRAELSR
jgi:hypothetical protein